MFSATSLLVLACASAIAFNVNALPLHCSPKVLIGQRSNNPLPLQPQAFAEKVVDVQIPDVSRYCLNDESGVEAYACDTDVQPSLHFLDFKNLIFLRNGDFTGLATVYVTVYCN